jgi:hypothetical protein
MTLDTSMIRAALLLAPLLAAASALACDRPDPGSAPAATAGTDASPASPAAPEPSASECAPLAALAALDTRRPVPLQPMMAWHQKQNMMEHLVAIQRITDGLARSDWDEIAEASALIETSPQMQQMCQHMGAGADGFTELALEFHRRADKIGVAAGDRDPTAVLEATASTLAVCTGCHASYRQDLVDAATWETRTGSVHDPALVHGG